MWSTCSVGSYDVKWQNYWIHVNVLFLHWQLIRMQLKSGGKNWITRRSLRASKKWRKCGTVCWTLREGKMLNSNTSNFTTVSKQVKSFMQRPQEILHTISKIESYGYRPQRSWDKVMFLQAYVILSTGGGGSASVHAGIPPPPQEQTPPPGTRHPPPEHSMLGDTVNERAVRILLECNLVQW